MRTLHTQSLNALEAMLAAPFSSPVKLKEYTPRLLIDKGACSDGRTAFKRGLRNIGLEYSEDLPITLAEAIPAAGTNLDWAMGRSITGVNVTVLKQFQRAATIQLLRCVRVEDADEHTSALLAAVNAESVNMVAVGNRASAQYGQTGNPTDTLGGTWNRSDDTHWGDRATSLLRHYFGLESGAAKMMVYRLLLWVAGRKQPRATVILSADMLVKYGELEFDVVLVDGLPTLVKRAYPAPQPGERFMDSAGSAYLILATGDAAELKTGRLRPLVDGAPAELTLGVSFQRAGAGFERAA